MIQAERTQRIIEYLSGSEILSVEEAIRRLGASPATVRRDFAKLAREGAVRRVRGGVRLARPAPGEIPSFELREILHHREKQAIAARAAQLLRPGDVAIIDGGTTTAMLGASIPDIPLRIITNSVRLTTVLEAHHAGSRLEIYLTGGILYPHARLLLGPAAKASVSQYHAHWAFLSVGGITEAGIFNTNELVVEVERAMIDSAERVVILADASKIGRHAMCTVCGLERIHMMITDARPEEHTLLARISEAGVQVITATPGHGSA